MSCYNSTIVNTPVEKVWATIKDFHDMTWAKGVIETLETVGDKKGFEPGAKRVLNGAFHETLLTITPDEHCFTYAITDGPDAVAKGAVNNYVGEVRLFPVTDSNTTLFLWTSTWKSGDDKAVAELCNPIYKAVLAAAKDNI